MTNSVYDKEHALLQKSQQALSDSGISHEDALALIEGYRRLLKESDKLVKFNDRTQEKLRKARLEADAANEAKSAFLATMSHEIRTPMNGVVGMIDVLAESSLDEDQRRMLDTVKESAFSLLHIINDILDFSKIEAGRMDLEIVPLSISSVIENISETIRPNAEKKSLEFFTYIDPELPSTVLGDPVRFRQIIFNLVGNAVKFTESKGDHNGRVVIWVERKGVPDNGKIAVQISIEDNGIGMSEEAVGRLFNPFEQAEASTTRQFGGTGLGLSICKTLVELMGGEISVSSEQGVGSRFAVELDLAESKDANPVEPEQDLAGIHVLCVTGVEIAREILTRYLAHRNAEVLHASSIDEAGSILKQTGPRDGSVVLLVGPDVDREGLSQLSGETKIVVLTPDRRERSRRNTTNYVLVNSMPVSRQMLIRGVAEAAGLVKATLSEPARQKTLRKAPTVEAAEAAGELILLVEDNKTNQDVITRQLRLLGYQSIIAENGEEGLAKLERHNIGAILTDVQMPVMDGFEMVANIRASEQGTSDRLPVIAITANALQGESDRCIAAGMDDYLSKPLEMKKLEAMLTKWLPVTMLGEPPASVDNEASEEVSPPTSGPSDSIDFTALTEVFGDDMETIIEILSDFIEPAWDIVGEVEVAVRERRAHDVGASGHKLKSSSKAVGAHELSSISETLEKAGKASDWSEIDQEAIRLRPAMVKVEDSISALRS